ncbi:MAG TPA: carboxymuconolactone decarboxylase family protein [Puia sp.]|jgi:AhpD family alkylhydroperoxidase
MKERINFYEKGHAAMKGLFTTGAYLAKSGLGQPLIDLVNFRVSQMNGCAYCLDMHAKDLRAMGESEQRLYLLSAWREAPLYSERERAALGWAEAVTKAEIPDEIYTEVCREFSEDEMIDLTTAVITINSFNRINIAFQVKAGDYQPGMHVHLIQNN